MIEEDEENEFNPGDRVRVTIELTVTEDLTYAVGEHWDLNARSSVRLSDAEVVELVRPALRDASRHRVGTVIQFAGCDDDDLWIKTEENLWFATFDHYTLPDSEITGNFTRHEFTVLAGGLA